MDISIFFLLLCLLQTFPLSSSNTFDTLRGTSLSVEKPSERLVSTNGEFLAGFFPVGDNAFCFSIWLNKSSVPTVVWMANRDEPVDGRGSTLSLLNEGKLILTNSLGFVIWQSFDSPIDTLLPQQALTMISSLISRRSQDDYSSGNYKLFFDNDNVLRLLFQGPTMSSLYWPDPWLTDPGQAGRSRYNTSRRALLDDLGNFESSDHFQFNATDYGVVLHRRLTLDPDGNLRSYSLQEMNGRWDWVVTYQAFSQPCRIHGICGPNSLCSYDHVSGRKCSCLQGFKMKDHTDWSYGCEPEFSISCNNTDESSFVQLAHVEYYGSDIEFHENATFQFCRDECLKRCDCNGFQYKFNAPSGYSNCYPKFLLLSGHHSPNFEGDFYLRLPKASPFNNKTPDEEKSWECSANISKQQRRTYENKTTQIQLHKDTSSQIDLSDSALNELRKATRGFKEVIGRGAGGTVYKGVLPDQRVAAIKQLNVANQGEAEFLAEVNTIGMLNHMYLIEMWGYCAEGKHKLLVYEYMEHGSLAENLSANALDWKKRFEIAVGTAKGLAYLHEECLEWVLHCDVKPQNILLDSNYQPKVADFGLSKLVSRSMSDHSSFSRMRGTRGYMAPEWVYNLPITSKVDVYSYGIVLLEMVTGKSPNNMNTSDSGETREHKRLVTLVREYINIGTTTSKPWIEEFIDPMMAGKYDKAKMELSGQSGFAMCGRRQE
uniref:non-specific serine/threonine protein kinase n=1 Tax=Fagus sylvatica TaxID=28930 RepID=A0A2N9G8Z2_FAGSY